MLKILFDTDNDAFVNYGATETARILRKIAKRIEDGDLDGEVMDLNGNSIGNYELSGD